MLNRLQKILSQRGVCSRRKAEEYLEAGLVQVNGRVVKVGDKADPELDTITVDGTVLKDRAEMLYYVMNKPEGVETTNVAQLPQALTLSVRDLLPPELQGKVYPVGRLDKDSSGLLLLTNDGVLAYRLTHPKFTHEKEYEVTVDRPMALSACRLIAEGMMLDGSMTKPLQCRKVATNRARIILTEGRNRQIRRMVQAAGYTVRTLTRIRIMTLEDLSLPPGSLRALTKAEKQKLLHSVGLEPAE